MERTWYIKLFFILIFNLTINAQEVNLNKKLNSFLLDFYSNLKTDDYGKSLKLISSIDSILLVKNELNIESLAAYFNAKGFVYYNNNLNPEVFLIKADSLNNLSPNPDINIKVYSSFLLGEYYYDRKDDLKAKKAYSKIIDFEGIPEKFYEYKSKALNKTFFIERYILSEKNNDSLAAKNTARKLINFNKLIKDTLNFEYGRSLEFLNNIKAAETIFLNIKTIPETDVRYNKYRKFQSLNWLNNFYYKNIGDYGVIDTLSAHKLLRVSEELLAVVKNTDYLKPHNIYSVYGDIVVASIITKDQKNIDLYESKILSLLNNPDYPSLTELDLGRFYYTLHKLKMYFGIAKDYEKAKFYAYKNVQLKKYLYGEFSIEYEKELLSYQNIIQLDMFDYEEAYKITLVREKIIKKLFSEDSIEYLQLLYGQYSIRLSQMEHKKGLTLLEKAIEIKEKIDCKNLKLCNDVWFAYLNCLNNNGLYNKPLELTKNLVYAEDPASLFLISQIRRSSYYGLNNYLGINIEFEWLLDKLENYSNILLKDENLTSYYLEFLTSYQEHLRNTGRINKAIELSEKNLKSFENEKYSHYRNEFLLGYLNVLFQNGEDQKALKFVNENTILKFSDITTPSSKAFFEHRLNVILGNIYRFLKEYNLSIKFYQKAIEYNGVDTSYLYIPLALQYNRMGDNNMAKIYVDKFEKENPDSKTINLQELYSIVDLFIQTNEREKILKYLLPLSDKIIDDICKKSFFSSDDNKTDKYTHDDVLRFILSNNFGDFYNAKLANNTVTISNLYKSRLEYYAKINLGIQKLKSQNNKDAIKIQQLENEYNRNPTKLIEEEIDQLKTKTINSDIFPVGGLCNISYNDIYESITENEVVINLMSYKSNLTQEDNFAINFNLKELSLTSTFVNLDNLFRLDKKEKIDSGFFDFVYNEIFQNKKVKRDLIDTFYIIPSGKSHLINFSAFSLSFEQKYNRKIKVHIINSLSDITTIKKEQPKVVDNLILIGDIDFDKASNNSLSNNSAQHRGMQLNNLIGNSGIQHWGYLPGTKQEIEEIKQLAIANNTKVSVLRGTEVTEPNLKKIIIDQAKNNVIHVATHAYFFSDKLSIETDNLYATHRNPLLRSGLVLSGANEFWNKKSLVDPNEDGVLTAEEISFMDLRGVELIVLSACDTGLGEISNLEGVNGLQRAFKLAGANKLIMSLWKVPDKETVEFFGYFYKFFLEEKLSVNDSFRETQRIMKDKYSPYYWAGFVLLE